jgi:hypothetical protein
MQTTEVEYICSTSLIWVLTCLFFDVRRTVPYFYVLVNSVFHELGSRLGFISGAPWWPAALASTIACGAALPQPSAQASSTHHGQHRPCLVWDQSTGGASGEYHHRQRNYVYFRCMHVIDYVIEYRGWLNVQCLRSCYSNWIFVFSCVRKVPSIDSTCFSRT